MAAPTLAFGPATLAPGAFAAVLASSAAALCAGHSVGMRRLLVHHALATPPWLGTLVGTAGPFGMIRAHDLRDRHQKQTECPDLPAHRAGFRRDAWWQLHGRLHLDHPPQVVIETERRDDPRLRAIERTSKSQQVPLAVALYLMGGLRRVIRGVPVRRWTACRCRGATCCGSGG
jgi:stearoyl-CoA desaturase (delta-9 desaturase)